MGIEKRSTKLSISDELLKDAKALSVNISKAAEHGIAQAVSRAKAQQWQKENAEAIESSNAYVEKHGLPLGKYRQF